MHKFWVTQSRTVAPDICGPELAHMSLLAPGNMMRLLELWKVSVSLVWYIMEICIIREVGCRCCLELHTSVRRYQTLYLKSKLRLVFIHSLVFSLEGRAWQEPEPSPVTGMALAHCILGKFLGVVCHCFPLPLDIPTLAARCLHPQRRERS